MSEYTLFILGVTFPAILYSFRQVSQEISDQKQVTDGEWVWLVVAG